MKRSMTTLGISAVLSLVGASASASPISFDLDTPNPGIAGFSGPYANVTVDLIDATHANVTFQSYGGFVMGGEAAVDLNVNGPVSVVGAIAGISTGIGFTPGPYTVQGSGNADGFGAFSFRLQSFDGYTHSASAVTFTLELGAGTWLNSSDVLTPNGGGYLAASHIFVCATVPCDADLNTGVTGFATDGAGLNLLQEAVPEPATLALLGSGLALAASRARSRRRR